MYRAQSQELPYDVKVLTKTVKIIENADLCSLFTHSSLSVMFPSQVFWWWKHSQERKDKSIWHLRSPVPKRNTA